MEKPVFITGNPCSLCRDPCFHYRDFPVRKLHRENPVFITENGFAVCIVLTFLLLEGLMKLQALNLPLRITYLVGMSLLSKETPTR